MIIKMNEEYKLGVFEDTILQVILVEKRDEISEK